MLELGVLISGRGSNLQAIIDGCASKALDANIRLVISNRKSAGGLALARGAGIETLTLSHRGHADREAYDDALVSALKAAGVQWVVLAGFMRIVTARLLDAFPSRVVNIHPSLLPAFPGLDAQQQALDYGVRASGCTVHLVNVGVDSGPILAQAVVPVKAGDHRDALAGRILKREHQLLVTTLQWLAEGRFQIHERPNQRAEVIIRGAEPLILPAD